MTNGKLRKHAFLTRRGLEYRENGKWKIEGWILENTREVDATLANFWSENRAIWILDEEWAKVFGVVLSQESRRFVVKRRTGWIPEDAESVVAEIKSGNIESYMMSERISFKPLTASEQMRGCLILFPEKAEQWEMSADDDPEVIERALAMLQEHFGRSLVYPPGRLSAYLMEGCREKAREQYDYKRPPLNFDPWMLLSGDVDDPLDDWKKLRPFMTEEKKAKYIHAFDKNSMYLQAVGIPLGLGEYHYYKNDRLLDGDRPGIWKVKSRGYETVRGFRSNYDGKPLFEEKHFPREFAPPGLRGSEPFFHWVTTPQFRLLCEMDLIADVEGAYLADDSAKLFATYYSHINQALNLANDLARNNLNRPDGSEIIERRKAHDVGRMARRFTKAIYSRGVGYLRAEFARKSGEWFYRPDWWAMIVSEAGARLFRDAREVWEAHKAWPVAVYVDCLYYAAEEADPIEALPAFGGRFANKYKHKGTCKMTKKLASAFEKGMAPGEFAGLFKRESEKYAGGEAR